MSKGLVFCTRGRAGRILTVVVLLGALLVTGPQQCGSAGVGPYTQVDARPTQEWAGAPDPGTPRSLWAAAPDPGTPRTQVDSGGGGAWHS